MYYALQYCPLSLSIIAGFLLMFIVSSFVIRKKLDSRERNAFEEYADALKQYITCNSINWKSAGKRLWVLLILI